MTTKLNSENVRENPDRYPQEKETIIRFDKRDEVAYVWTGEAGLMRRLLKHDEFEVDERKSIERDGHITAVHGTLPIGCLKVLGTPRKNPGHAEIVSRSNTVEPVSQPPQ